MLRPAVVREGVIAGVSGASAVAVWFFIADVIAGTPLRTPRLLAAAAYGVFGGNIGDATFMPVLAYTLFHFAAFVGVGVALTATLEAARTRPGHLAGLFLLWAVFEAGFYGLCMTLSMLDVVGTLAWYQIAAANMLASLVMGTFLWRRHPEAVRGLNAALKGTTP